METDERRGWRGWRAWRRTVREALRPEGEVVRPSRLQVVNDALLALVLALCAVIALYHVNAGHQIVVLPHPQPTGPFAQPTRAFPQGPPEGLPPLPPFNEILVHVDPGVREVVLALLTALPLAGRRRFPLATFWVVVCATLADLDWANPVTLIAWAVAAYSAVVHSRNLVPTMGSFALVTVFAAQGFHHVDTDAESWSGYFVALPIAALIVSLVRYWQHRLQVNQERLVELQQAHEEATRRAVEEERARIAAELHDVVTHNVSVMVIQAGAARTVMDSSPEQSKQALLAVEAGGRAAMAELRHVMGLLAATGTIRADGTDEDLEPQPGLDQLDTLIERIRATGLQVTLTAALPADPLPPGVDLTAYRVVQEALTNTIKHATGSTASVTIGHEGDWLEIAVTDTGGAPGPQAATGNGRGLIGLRERLAVYGGTLDAGPRIGGGHRIMARLPWRTV